MKLCQLNSIFPDACDTVFQRLFNLFGFLSRSQVTWNPSFTSVVKYSFMCPTTEEHKLPIIHGNDRVEWFFQMCDEIHWNCGNKNTGEPMARVIMKAGDMAAMPAYCMVDRDVGRMRWMCIFSRSRHSGTRGAILVFQ